MGESKILFQVEEQNIASYLKDISKYRTLKADEELELARKIRDGDKDALRKLITHNLRFVVSVSRNYQNQGMQLADLINEGNLGLMRAAERFDDTKNFKFISYAVWWIRQSILQALADHSRIVKVPLNRVASIHKIGKTRQVLEQKFMRAPTNEEVAEAMGMSEKDILNILRVGSRHASFDAPIKDENGGTFIDFYQESDESDRTVSETDAYSEASSITHEMMKIIEVLNEKEQQVLQLYFGINHSTNYTLEEIGSQLNITRERVRQVKDTALRKLKRSVKAQKLKNLFW
jgi:RNA polymerase primary sigma factor